MRTLKAATLSIAVIFATSLHAHHADRAKSCDTKKSMCDKQSKSCDSYVEELWNLDLTPDQTQQLLEIVIKHKVPQKEAAQAFSVDRFDKRLYLEIMKQKKDAKFKMQADIISDAYEILTTKQKERYIKQISNNSKM